MNKELQNRFAYHPPRNPEEIRQHGEIRERFKDLVTHLDDMLPDGREKALVITKLQEAQMWANAAIAIPRGLDT